jgi:hypothetical protein
MTRLTGMLAAPSGSCLFEQSHDIRIFIFSLLDRHNPYRFLAVLVFLRLPLDSSQGVVA